MKTDPNAIEVLDAEDKGGAAGAGAGGSSAAPHGRPMMSAPIGSPAEWFGPDQYPVAALRAGEEGRVVADVTVDEHGKPIACAVRQSSGSASLDSRTCEIAMTQATFTPARDAAGQPLASHYPLSVRWALPDQHAAPIVIDVSVAPPPDKVVETELTFGADGTVLGCRTILAQSDAQAIDPCQNVQIGARTRRRWRRNGRLVGAKVTQRFVDHTIVDP